MVSEALGDPGELRDSGVLGNQIGAGSLEIPAKAEALARATPLRAGQRAFPVQMLLWEERSGPDCVFLSCRRTVTLSGCGTLVAVAFLEQCGAQASSLAFQQAQVMVSL